MFFFAMFKRRMARIPSALPIRSCGTLTKRLGHREMMAFLGESSSSRFTKLPVLSLPPENATEENRHKFALDLRQTCHNIGFFYISHHGLKKKTEKNILEASKAFFNLNMEQKMQVSYLKSSAFRGYIKIGSKNTNGETDYREQMEFGVDSTDTELRRYPYMSDCADPINIRMRRQSCGPVWINLWPRWRHSRELS